MESLKVLMMGGLRCGKTSALASLFDQTIHSMAHEVFTVTDNTELETIDGMVRTSLMDKRLELVNIISKGGNNTFMVDRIFGACIFDYTLQIQITGTRKSMDIVFRDVPGSFFDAGTCYHDSVVDFVNESDVFVVVIDTPYLMSENRVEAELANDIASIHNFLMQIDNEAGRKAKQVIFVPVKCEKWAKESRIDEVVDAVEKYYSMTIKNLKAFNKMEISIIPIQTAGDIIFSDLRDPYVLFNTLTNKKSSCSKLNDKVVVFPNGICHKVAENEIIGEDVNSLFYAGGKPTNLVRRTAWFNLPHEHKAQYSPHNCEQLLFHIIRFMFNKKIWETSFLSQIFGIALAKNMQDALNKLSNANLIKDSGEGIKVIEKCF